MSQRRSIRKAACTHIHLTRLYGDHKCKHCGKTPNCGWVLRCTQDHDWLLPLTEANHPPLAQVFTKEGVTAEGQAKAADVDESRLTPWVERAIAEGHYTDEQVKKLRAQRRRVLDCIRSDKNSLSQLLSSSSHVSIFVRGPSSPFSASALTPDQLQKISEFVGIAERAEGSDRSQEPIGCNYKTCNTCRPLSKDRSWECIEHNFNAANTPVNFDTDNRRLSSPLILRQIGLKMTKGLKAYESSTDIDAKNRTDPTDSEPNETDAKEHPLRFKRGPSHSRRRDNLRHDFLFWKPSSDSLSSLDPGANEEHDSQAVHGKPRGLRRVEAKTFSKIRNKGKGIATKEGETSGSSRRPLSRASGYSASDDGYRRSGELKVMDGIAVTEEGVDSRAADIIMRPVSDLGSEGIVAHG